MSEELLDALGPPLVERTVGEADRVRPDAFSVVVVETVAAVANTTVEDLPPLYERTDPDALDSLFATAEDGIYLFSFDEYLVGVTADGTVSVFEGPNGDGAVS
jgi:hypothetical protein